MNLQILSTPRLSFPLPLWPFPRSATSVPMPKSLKPRRLFFWAAILKGTSSYNGAPFTCSPVVTHHPRPPFLSPSPFLPCLLTIRSVSIEVFQRLISPVDTYHPTPFPFPSPFHPSLLLSLPPFPSLLTLRSFPPLPSFLPSLAFVLFRLRSFNDSFH